MCSSHAALRHTDPDSSRKSGRLATCRVLDRGPMAPSCPAVASSSRRGPRRAAPGAALSIWLLPSLQPWESAPASRSRCCFCDLVCRFRRAAYPSPLPRSRRAPGRAPATPSTAAWTSRLTARKLPYTDAHELNPQDSAAPAAAYDTFDEFYKLRSRSTTSAAGSGRTSWPCSSPRARWATWRKFAR